MAPGYTLNNLAALKALICNDGSAFIVKGLGWFQYKQTASDAADDVNIIQPDSGVGRWFLCNNSVNIRNDILSINSTSSTELDIANYDTLHLTLTTNTTITFTPTLRNGIFYLIITRNTYNITSWDNRIQWISTPLSFTTGQLTYIAMFLVINDVIYELQRHIY